MKKITETNEFVVYDELLGMDNFQQVQQAIHAEDFSIPHIEKWLKVWRLSDGLAMGSENYSIKNAPFNNYMDLISKYFIEIANQHTAIVGKYNDIVLRCYLYGRETKLNWHNDKGYIAAGIFYAHPYWASTWGGELMLAHTPQIDGPMPNPCLDHAFEDKFLEHYGLGQYITCKPNRLVLTKGGVWHSINRVDKDAGDHIRTSIVAFYI
jgi:hypothetical protein